MYFNRTLNGHKKYNKSLILAERKILKVEVQILSELIKDFNKGKL